MSFKIIGAAFELALVGNDKLVFLALCENADDTTRTCFPSYSTIQRKASLANSSLKTALEVLEAIGLISIKIRSTKGGGRTSTLYKISEFDVEKFDIANYKKIAREIRAVRNFREKKVAQPPKIDSVKIHPNLRKSAQIEETPQPPKFDTILDTQPPKFGEEPLASPFQPLAFREVEEEEGCEVEIVAAPSLLPSLVIPSAMGHLPPELVEKAIDKAVARGAKYSPVGYRRDLLNGLAVGDEGWIRTVLEYVKQIETSFSASEKPWEREKRLKREQGEAMYLALQNCGFSNPGEAYSALAKMVQDDF